MQRNTGYFPTESLEPSGNRLFSRSALNEGYLFRGSLVYEVTKIHRLAPEVDGVKPYIDGFEIKILGMTVYRETNE